MATTVAFVALRVREAPAPVVSDPIFVPVAPVQTSAPAAPNIDAMDYAQAFTTARRGMSDTINTESPGTVLFSLWAAKHLLWSDVAVTTDETTNALALKDPERARGRRLCTSGQIVQIEREKGLAVSLFSGIMSNGGVGLYRFFAAGGTGDLVAESYARFCGVVTGLYDYSNSGGGTGHAVTIVGMFDLPENKPSAQFRAPAAATAEAPEIDCTEPFFTDSSGKLAIKKGCEKR